MDGIKLYLIIRELQVAPERIIAFLKKNGHGESITGTGADAEVTDNAYQALRAHFGRGRDRSKPSANRPTNRPTTSAGPSSRYKHSSDVLTSTSGSPNASTSLKEKALQYLRQGLDTPAATFRDGQWEAIRDVVQDSKTVLLVRRTGWGKSMVYFLATRLLRDQGAGPTLLISPLLALMRNQIEAAERIGINAATINSSNKEDWDRIERKIHDGAIDVLLISPERLSNESFRRSVLDRIADRVGLFVVDEAHCISDWGHDFRPDYQRITRIVQAMPGNVPVLATTATANDRVVDDVVQQIGPDMNVSRGPLARSSLRLQNIKMQSPTDRMAWLAEHVPTLSGSGIIYTLTVRDAQNIAEWLQSQGVNVRAYSGRRNNETRQELEQALLNNEVKALVATVALGMGFDKPDLGFVIHYQRPGSVVHYYQQVGRAGRDGNTAYGVLLHGKEDDDIIDYFIRSSFPVEANVHRVLNVLDDAQDGLKVRGIEQQVNMKQSDIRQVLKFLSVQEQSPVEKSGSRWYRTPVSCAPDREKVKAIKAIRRAEQEEMQRYMEHDGCLMAFLQSALDDPHASPCGICAGCADEPLIPEQTPQDVAQAAATFLQRSEMPIKPRKRWPYTDSLSSYGWKSTMADHVRAEEGRALSIWGDAGWGKMVKEGKYENGRFSDRLVQAAKNMIQQRWKPAPMPEWVTCVPSNNRPELVPNYAARLAQALNLPFVACVQKVKANRPQKQMENSEQQTSNLDGVFAVDDSQVHAGPVLLVDDTVDSRWTLTITAALLKEAGAGPVYPFALAKTTPTSA